MGTTVLEVLLLAWIMLALAVMVVMGVRRSRRNRSDPNWSRRSHRPDDYGTAGHPRGVVVRATGRRSELHLEPAS